jgi:hypothetical protein
MQVSLQVKEAIDEVSLYANLEHRPDVAAQFISDEDAQRFEEELDVNYFNVFNQVRRSPWPRSGTPRVRR